MANENKGFKGLLKAENLMVIQKKKNILNEAGDYYYNLGLTNGDDLLVVTAGKAADSLELLKRYDFGFDFVDKKLKLISYKAVQ